MCQRSKGVRVDLQLRDFEMSDSETELLLDSTPRGNRGGSGGTGSNSNGAGINSERRGSTIQYHRNRRRHSRKLGTIIRNICR